MAAKHGSTSRVAWNQYDVSSYLRSAELSVGVEAADTTTFGNGWKTGIVGLGESSASFEGLYDPTTQAHWRDQLGVSSGVLTYAPSGWAAIGDPARLLLGTSTSYVESSPVGDVVSFSWEVMSEAHFAGGQVLHPLGEDTNTTTGASKDDSAATTTGWAFHLHVTAVDGGSWEFGLNDSANNSDWAYVTGSVATLTTAGVQRVSSAVGATLRRYVRYTATRTGGTAGDGISFLLAYSRTTG
jgi:hypothetical protein